MFWRSAGWVVLWVCIGKVQYSALALRKNVKCKPRGKKKQQKNQPIPTLKVETCINLREFPWPVYAKVGGFCQDICSALWQSVPAVCVCSGNEEQGGIFLLTAAVITLLLDPSLNKPVIYMWFKWMKMQFKGLLWCHWESVEKLPLTQPGFHICPLETTNEPGKWYKVYSPTDGFWNYSTSCSSQLSLFSK